MSAERAAAMQGLSLTPAVMQGLGLALARGAFAAPVPSAAAVVQRLNQGRLCSQGMGLFGTTGQALALRIGSRCNVP